MTFLDAFEPWWRFAAAILIGALIGLEREFVQQRSGEQEFGGIRTFALMALLGAIAAYFTQRFGLLLFMGTYVGLVLLLWASNIGPAMRGEEEGITTEIAALMTPLLGAMVIWDAPELAAALGVVTALILALKPGLHDLARRMNAEDLRATLEFAIITAVILPLLPNVGYGPYNLLNPFLIWLLVVFVSGIGFIGYVLMKVLGAEEGIGLTGLLGGLVSSTATTLSFAGRSKSSLGLSDALAQGILLASSVMFPRVLVEVAVVNRQLLVYVAIPLGAMMLVGALIVGLYWLRHRAQHHGEQPSKVRLGNPLRLRTAIGFGVLFTLVLVAVRAANEYLGSAGVYAASVLTGVTDVDSITLSVADLSANGALDARVAGFAIVLASLVNTATKAITAGALGSKELRRTIWRSFGLVLLTGITVSALTFLVFAP
ncbi:MAG: MgtC/SapB family protein [Anaerolineales bacterium]|jgi:uncharacterized membrane protein (DUF4010 family)